MVYGITIKNVGDVVTINNGKAIWLRAARITIPWKKEVKTAVMTNWDLSHALEGGLNNPVIAINGFINWDDAGTDVADVNGEEATIVNDELLRQLVLFRENLEEGNVSRLLFRGYWGAHPVRSMLTGNDSFYVVVESVTLNLTSDSEGNHLWAYSMTLREVK